MIPNIKKYLDVHQYLQDCYSHRKESDPHFSYEVWAKEMNASDKSYIRMMVLGKRHINVTMTEAFGRNMKLSSEDSIYFNYLVQYTQAKTHTVREALGKKLISLISSELDQLEVQNQLEFLSNPLLPRLQVLLSFKDLDQSALNLSWILNVEKNLIEEGFQSLLRLGLVTLNDGRYSPAKRSFKINDNFKSLGLEAFYLQNLEDSKNAIALPSETRRYKNLFLPLTADEFKEFWKSVEDFSRQQLAKFNPDEYKERRLYQTHFNIIPVTAERPSDQPLQQEVVLDDKD